MDSTRKLAVVTGASHGIGREIAMVLAERGFVVRGIGLYERDIRETHDEARRRSLDVEVFEGDVSEAAQVEKFARWLEKAGGGRRRSQQRLRRARPRPRIRTIGGCQPHEG